MTAIRTTSGATRMIVARQDISRLDAAGWVPPIPFVVKARDGKTDLYGFMFQPSHMDSSKMYSIINRIYPGPQTGSCGSRSFLTARGDPQANADSASSWSA